MNGSLQVSVHELENEVEVSVILRPVHVQKPDDVGVVPEMK